MNQLYPIKIILADDHPVYRDGIRSLISQQPGMALIAEAEDGNELIEQARKHSPDIILTDIKMPALDGIEATKILTREFPHIGIIALSMFNDDHFIVDMLNAGARGYLLKDAHKVDIVDAIKTVRNNQTYYCRNTNLKLLRLIASSSFDQEAKTSNVSFSKKEKEIMILICKEFTSREISRQMNLSVRTVEGYREAIIQKTSSRNVAGVIIYALRNNIYQPD